METVCAGDAARVPDLRERLVDDAARSPTAIAIKLTSRGPVFYSAERIGVDGRPFSMLKFRTMHGDGEDRLRAVLASRPQPLGSFRLDKRFVALGARHQDGGHLFPGGLWRCAGQGPRRLQHVMPDSA